MTIKCTETENLLSAHYDNELSGELRVKVDSHIGKCAECQAQLKQFKKLSSLAASLKQPATPPSVWSAVTRHLDDQIETSKTIASTGRFLGIRRFQLMAAIAAMIVIGFFGFSMWQANIDSGHQAMVEAIEQVAIEINADQTPTLLLNKFGGSEVSFKDALTQVGYRPVASRGLPLGYSVENVQVLNMPCCKCTQTACKKPDASRLFIYEHDKKTTGWFENRKKHLSEYCGKICEIAELDNQFAVTWEKRSRYITLLGVRDDKEIELLVSKLEE